MLSDRICHSSGLRGEETMRDGRKKMPAGVSVKVRDIMAIGRGLSRRREK